MAVVAMRSKLKEEQDEDEGDGVNEQVDEVGMCGADFNQSSSSRIEDGSEDDFLP